METLVNISEAAKLLTASSRTLQRWMCEGILPYVKIGKLVRLKLSDIERIQNEGLPRRPAQ
ncbi:MAG: helix-turn-helix domain-containing protein [Candidatus Aenigmarchaeota archaeon]|nr:helix-turn-helix domain-containing protein [Candidatus Aenigmarchaeota archaeon]